MNQLVATNEPLSVVAYNAMLSSIAKSESLAECKDIADQAAALQGFARRIRNFEAERRACNIRMVSERRYGELLKELARATPQTANVNGRAGKEPAPAAGGGSATPYAQALAATGVSQQAASRYQALAKVPKATQPGRGLLTPQVSAA
jgi:hypothetical protein